MTDPFTSWSRMMRAAFDVSMLGTRMLETAVASLDVVSARMPLIAEAICSPQTANVDELGRMVPEKVEAFSSAGTAWMHGWSAMNMAMWAES